MDLMVVASAGLEIDVGNFLKVARFAFMFCNKRLELFIAEGVFENIFLII